MKTGRQARALAAPLVLGLAVIACSSQTQVDLLEPVRSFDAGHPLPEASTEPEASPPEDASSNDASSSEAGATGGTTHTASHLIHRYSFDGEDTVVIDSIAGNPSGELMGGATLDGNGHATLDGKDDYVNLPNGLISRLTDATLVTWLTWSGGNCWQRVFDFGSTDTGEDMVGNATSSVFATTLHCPGNGPSTAIGTTGIMGSVDSDTPFPQLQNTPITVVFDVTGGQLRMYVSGKLAGTGVVQPLSSISDVNDWLGQSQWTQDLHLRGTYDEFRIYDTALTEDEIHAVEAAGPDVIAP